MDISYSPPGAIARDYILDRSYVSMLIGPVGSGKTVASIMKGIGVSMAQEPYDKTRYSRGLILRNTYPELRSTVIKSFQEWFPEEVAPINWASPITAKLDFWLPDKTRVKCELLFLALDRPEDAGKLRSLEITWAAISEASEINKGVFDMLTQRVGRYPPARWGGPTFSGVFGDTNPPDDDHWIYRIFEEEKPKDYRIFHQPGALKLEKGEWIPNEGAENIHNIQLGYDYWLRQVSGKTRDWCKVFLGGQYGTVASGKPVYPEYSDEMHCRPTKPYPNLPILLGFDYGLTPACVICQVSPRGQLLILNDITSENMGIRQFANDIVKPFLSMNYPRYTIYAVGDPAGNARKDTDEKTCFMELAEAGIPCMPAITNNFQARREAVAGYLTKLIDGQPALIVSPEAKAIRKGFNGGYCFKRVQVSGDEKYRDMPDKNSYSHPHDALQYAALYTQTMKLSADFGKKIDYPKMGIV